MKGFIYRIKQKLKYHFATSEVEKLIAEINRNEKKIAEVSSGYRIDILNLTIPYKKFDYIFKRYDLLIKNATTLNGFYSIHNDKLLFKWANFSIYITSESEIYIINEIFVEQCYNFRLPNQSVVIIDMGMNVGIASLFFASHPQVKKIYSYEPFVPTFNKGLENLQANHTLSNKVVPNNFGLGLRDETITVPYNPDNTGINSTTIHNPRVKEETAFEKLIIKSAKQEVEKIISNGNEDFYFIKLDTEGAEYDIFESLFEGELNQRIKGFMIEWHFKGSAILEEKLVQEGFSIFTFRLNRMAGLIYALR